MKKLLPILCILLLLVSCGKTPAVDPDPAVDPIVKPDGSSGTGDSGSTGNQGGTGYSGNTGNQGGTADAPKPETGQPTGDAAAHQMTTAYRYGMDDYEDMRIAYLGCITHSRSLDDIIERAKKEFGFTDILNEITDDEIIYGDLGDFVSNVYLIIPAWNTDLTVGRYSWYANQIVETWYSRESSWPILYIERGEMIDIPGRIEYVRHFADGNTDGWMYTNFNCTNGQLRTDYHMGIVDITPYEYFTTEEISNYSQSFFDALCGVGEVNLGLSKGYHLNVMEEMIYDGEPYALYYLSDTKGDPVSYYLIRYDFNTGQRTIRTSTDLLNWMQVGMG